MATFLIMSSISCSQFQRRLSPKVRWGMRPHTPKICPRSFTGTLAAIMCHTYSLKAKSKRKREMPCANQIIYAVIVRNTWGVDDLDIDTSGGHRWERWCGTWREDGSSKALLPIWSTHYTTSMPINPESWIWRKNQSISWQHSFSHKPFVIVHCGKTMLRQHPSTSTKTMLNRLLPKRLPMLHFVVLIVSSFAFYVSVGIW